ncbi:MAG: hypothetical protein EZS28_017594, partial [Streblomastix strix]
MQNDSNLEQQPLPLNCYPDACVYQDQKYPCSCTENKDIDRDDCLCVDNSVIKPGACTCGNHLHHPFGCICANDADWDCLCNDRNDNPWDCFNFCELDEFPDQDYCYCREDDYKCKTGPLPCTGGTYDDPTPPGCNISQCIKKDQKYPCTCTGNKQFDRDDCYCKERSMNLQVQVLAYATDNMIIIHMVVDDNPYDCISYCTEGHFPFSDQCLCDPSDTVCNAGRQTCTGGPFDDPTPSGCNPGPCKDKDQKYPCTCTGDKEIDRDDCQCSGYYYDDVDPGSCVCSLNYEHHPDGCTCAGPDDYNCVCNNKDDPYFCLTICNQGQFPSYDDCLSAFDDITCKAGPQKCSGGTYQQPLPLGCQPDFCESPDQEYPCICTGEKDIDREKCQCSSYLLEDAVSGTCTCGEWPYHPDGCVCKDSNDYGCVCNGEDDPYDCYPFCQVGEFPVKDYCYCREDDDLCNEGPKTCTGGTDSQPLPIGCNPGACKDKDQKYPCTCTGDKQLDRVDCQCTANSWEFVSPGQCRCGNLYVNHPSGCTCTGPDDIGCVCSGDDDPSDCYLQCSEGQIPNYDQCFCGLDDDDCNAGPQQCTEQHHPLRCNCPYTADDVANIPKRRCSCVYKDQREECQKDSIYYFVGTIDDNHITDFKPYKEGISASDSSFLSISKEEFEKLKLTKALTQDEINCEMVEQTREFYSSLGIIAKVMNDVDIAPSATYMIAAGPNKVTFINVPQEDKKFFKDIEISQSCYDENLYISLQIGLQKTGISDSTCFPNTGIPADITECFDSETSPEVYLQDYSVGGFEYADVETVKQMLIRFGMVYSYDYGIILGWENNNWVVAEQESDTSYKWKTHTINEMNYEGSIFIKVKDEQAPVDCSDVSDKIKEECPCIDNDSRDQCKIIECKDPTTAPNEGCICTGTNYPNKCICPEDPESLVKIPTDRCPCIDNDLRDECKPVEEDPKPSEEEPDIDDYPEFVGDETNTKIVKNDEKERDPETNTFENKINDAIDDERKSLDIQVVPNEIYEEKPIQISDGQQYIIEPDNIINENPILRYQESDEGGKPTPIYEPLVCISGTGSMEIKSFVIQHFQQSTLQPLLYIKGDGSLLLNNVTLSGDQYEKQSTGEITTSSGSEKTTPYIHSAGKLVVLNNGLVESSQFKGCNAILLNGFSGQVKNQFKAQNSQFQVLNNNKDNLNFLEAQYFNVVIKQSSFLGKDKNTVNANKVIANAVTKETCDWSSSSVNVVGSITFFDNIIFSNLGDGALRIGNKGLVTLKDSVSFYGNNPIDTNGNKKSIARNIICQGVPGGSAQLLANSSSFKEVGGEVSKNKWVLADKDYCIISGSLNNEKTLLFTPEIQSITAKGNKDKTGIDVELK